MSFIFFIQNKIFVFFVVDCLNIYKKNNKYSRGLKWLLMTVLVQLNHRNMRKIIFLSYFKYEEQIITNLTKWFGKKKKLHLHVLITMLKISAQKKKKLNIIRYYIKLVLSCFGMFLYNCLDYTIRHVSLRYYHE